MSLFLSSSPHQQQRRSTSTVMLLVCAAAVPGILMQSLYFGWGTLIQILIACITAVVTEAVILAIRKKDFERAITDYSALLTGLLLAICLPPLAPWWITVIGSFFAIAMVKQLYGGLGYNPFNPAMAAYVMLLVSFPVQMTAWMPPLGLAEFGYNLADAFAVIFSGYSVDGYSLHQLRLNVDGVTMATPLDAMKTGLDQGLTVGEVTSSAIFSGSTGIGWFAVNLAYLIGGLAMLRSGLINWHIPISMLAGATLMSASLYVFMPDQAGSPIFHLFSGGMMLGAFFIATDPVSSSTTNRGRLIFGASIGFWVVIIRTWGGYPDAIAFAVLFMNMAVPLIDYYTRPRTYGHQPKHPSKTVSVRDKA